MAKQTTAGTAGKLAAPAYHRPRADLNPGDLSKRIACETTPILRSSQSFRLVGLAFSAHTKPYSPISGASDGHRPSHAHGTSHAHGASHSKSASEEAVEHAEHAKDAVSAGKTMAEGSERMGKLIEGGKRALDGEQRVLKAVDYYSKLVGQLGGEAARAKSVIIAAEDSMGHFRSSAAESALVFMRPELKQLEAAFETQKSYQKGFEDLRSRLHGKITGDPLARIAHQAEKLLSRNPLAESILEKGRLALSSKWVGRSVSGIGAGAGFFKGYTEGPAESTAAKIAYGAANAVVAYAGDKAWETASMGLAKGSLAAQMFDPAIKYGAMAINKKFGTKLDGEGWTMGKYFDESLRGGASLVKGMWTGDCQPMNTWHKQTMAGAEGRSKILKGYAMLGESLSHSAIMDHLTTKAAERNLPEEFKTPTTWWDALSSDAHSLMDVGRGAVMTMRGQ